jgi:hypothetical protein
VAVVLEVPVGVGSEPVLVAAVEDDPGLGRDPVAVEQLGEALGADEVAL